MSYMKKILLVSSVITLLTTSGCIVDDGHRGHAGYGRHDDVVVAGPAVVVRPAVIVVH
jgi:hypothetical protein